MRQALTLRAAFKALSVLVVVCLFGSITTGCVDRFAQIVTYQTPYWNEIVDGGAPIPVHSTFLRGGIGASVVATEGKSKVRVFSDTNDHSGQHHSNDGLVWVYRWQVYYTAVEIKGETPALFVEILPAAPSSSYRKFASKVRSNNSPSGTEIWQSGYTIGILIELHGASTNAPASVLGSWVRHGDTADIQPCTIVEFSTRELLTQAQTRDGPLGHLVGSNGGAWDHPIRFVDFAGYDKWKSTIDATLASEAQRRGLGS